jgi:hypothetical protein
MYIYMYIYIFIYIGKTRERIPLLAVVAASNELPESQELDALYDRYIHMYIHTVYINIYMYIYKYIYVCMSTFMYIRLCS